MGSGSICIASVGLTVISRLSLTFNRKPCNNTSIFRSPLKIIPFPFQLSFEKKFISLETILPERMTTIVATRASNGEVEKITLQFLATPKLPISTSLYGSRKKKSGSGISCRPEIRVFGKIRRIATSFFRFSIF